MQEILNVSLENLKFSLILKEQNCHKLVSFYHIMLYHMFRDQLNILTLTHFAQENGQTA